MWWWIIIWYLMGIICFFISRWAWQLTFKLKPFSLLTLFSAIFAAIFGPVLLILAIGWIVSWLFDDLCSSSHVPQPDWAKRTKAFLKTPLFNRQINPRRQHGK